MKKRMTGRLLIATLADTNAIREELEGLKEELVEIKKLAKMTDHEKNAMFWAECQASLPNISRVLKEIEEDE